MKKFYVTTAIPYVNAPPHIGTMMDYLLADCLARYHRLNGLTVRFQAGTDEHGNKVARKAAEAGLSPQEYADKLARNFEEAIRAADISYTDFIRTSDPKHQRRVQEIWRRLKPHLYKANYTGWYCSGCESFVTDLAAAANNGVCPDHRQPYQRLNEENYFFKLSAFAETIKQAILAGKMTIQPDFRQKEVLQLLDGGLEDVSVSRPKQHVGWGVGVPDDDTQVIYVWIDALSNYLTVLGYPDDEAWREFWPADVQVIGKDILRFHAAIWPAILLALDLPLPKRLLAHGFVNIEGTKISKSLNNAISPRQIIETYGADAFRYYLLRHVPTLDDGDFTWEKFENAYNGELGNELGNLVQRVAAMIGRYQHGVIGDLPRPKHDTKPYHEAMQAMQLDRAFDFVFTSVRSLNVYLENVQPWQVAKRRDQGDVEAEAHLGEILAYAASSLEQIAFLLTPFMPRSAEIITKIFADGVITPYQGVLFPRLYKHTPAPSGQSSNATPSSNESSKTV
ncbi:MAG: methionine--tRNA ligase [Candidatus Chaera renei]|uniref:Methionine--tRNA ligase n=1 Tax=Candidatus Chaera renei TaxID=2506947 RepID=A0A4Q0AFY2_9BACT|nr:MAG: methionine--tRNA ligase [Candidatus Chaera renei]